VVKKSAKNKAISEMIVNNTAAVKETRVGRCYALAAYPSGGGAILSMSYSRIPIIAPLPAGALGIYGLIKKTIFCNGSECLTVETIIMIPAVAFLPLVTASPGAVYVYPPTVLFLVAAGDITALLLGGYVNAAKRLRYFTLDLMLRTVSALAYMVAAYRYANREYR
jgi:RarD protein